MYYFLNYLYKLKQKIIWNDNKNPTLKETVFSRLLVHWYVSAYHSLFNYLLSLTTDSRNPLADSSNGTSKVLHFMISNLQFFMIKYLGLVRSAIKTKLLHHGPWWSIKPFSQIAALSGRRLTKLVSTYHSYQIRDIIVYLRNVWSASCLTRKNCFFMI